MWTGRPAWQHDCLHAWSASGVAASKRFGWRALPGCVAALRSACNSSLATYHMCRIDTDDMERTTLPTTPQPPPPAALTCGVASGRRARAHGPATRGASLAPGAQLWGCAPGSQYMGMSQGFCSVHAWFASPLPARNAQGSSAVAARPAALLADGVLERTAPDFDPVAVVRRAGGQVEAHPTARREVQCPRCAVVAPLLGLVPGLTLPEPDAVARRRAAACGTTTHSALREERSGRPTSRLRHTLTQVVQTHRRVGSGLDRPLRGIHDPLLVLQTLRQCERAGTPAWLA